MSESASPLPARPSIEQLRKRAKERLVVMRAKNPRRSSLTRNSSSRASTGSTAGRSWLITCPQWTRD